jgi:hypothetical protein
MISRRAVFLLVGILALLGMAAWLWLRPRPAPLSPTRLADDPARGPANAPVTIIEYGDFG